MPKKQISCPNCRQPVMADIEQVFDVGVDPTAKQRLLSGAVNMIQCPNCRYQGSIATPIVYHDPDKELLLTYVPAELGLPLNEQERLIGGLINQVVNKLPQEKRKAYILRPQTTLTFQGLVERVLEAEGITREMIQAQQQRVGLIQRLMNASSEDVLIEMAKQEDNLIDADFFALLRRLIEAALMSGDQESAQALAGMQETLLPVTTFGKELQMQTQEVEAAAADLQKIGKDLNREKLLQLVISAPNETRLQALVSLVRPLMDYEFFSLLSERIDRARGEGRSRLVQLRESLLNLTQEVDQHIAAQAQASRQLLQEILQSKDITEATIQNLPAVDQFFVDELNLAMQAARKDGDLEKISNLQKIVDVLQQASKAPPEVALIEEMLEIPDDQGLRKYMEDHADEITPELLNALGSIISQVEASEDKELAERIRKIHRMALRFSMEKNLQ